MRLERPGRSISGLLGMSVVMLLSACDAGGGPNDITTPAEAVIEAHDGRFEPASMTVAAGTEVTFTNEDDVTHHFAAGTPDDGQPGPGELDERLEPGLFLVRVYPEPGEYPLFCRIHADMTGMLEVVD